MKQYEIIENVSKDKLERAVESRFRDDWEPLGGVCITNGAYYSQALVRTRPSASLLTFIDIALDKDYESIAVCTEKVTDIVDNENLGLLQELQLKGATFKWFKGTRTLIYRDATISFFVPEYAERLRGMKFDAIIIKGNALDNPDPGIPVVIRCD